MIKIQFFKNSHKNVAIALILISVALGALGVWAYLQHRAAELEKKDLARYESSILQFEELRDEERYDEAIYEARDYINISISDTRKATSYMRIASVFEMKGDHEAALREYRLAEALYADSDKAALYQGMGRSAHRAGDKETAITYYKKSISILETKDYPSVDMDIIMLKKRVEQLEKAR